MHDGLIRIFLQFMLFLSASTICLIRSALHAANKKEPKKN